MSRMMIFTGLLLVTSSVSGYPALQDRFSVPIEHRQMVVDQFDAYLEPLSDFDKRVVAAMAYMLIEQSNDGIVQTQSSREAALHAYELALELIKLTMNKVDWSEPAEFIDNAVNRRTSQEELGEERDAFLNSLLSEYDSQTTENTQTAEQIGQLMADTYKAYAIENALASKLSKDNDRELAEETAKALQEASSADFPQKVSDRLTLQRVISSGASLTFVGQLSYSAEELNLAWSEADAPEAQMRFQFLEQMREGVCSNDEIRSRFLKWSGSVSYKYLFNGGSEFLTQTIAACP